MGCAIALDAEWIMRRVEVERVVGRRAAGLEYGHGDLVVALKYRQGAVSHLERAATRRYRLRCVPIPERIRPVDVEIVSTPNRNTKDRRLAWDIGLIIDANGHRLADLDEIAWLVIRV